jgi:hypothetical protein
MYCSSSKQRRACRAGAEQLCKDVKTGTRIHAASPWASELPTARHTTHQTPKVALATKNHTTTSPSPLHALHLTGAEQGRKITLVGWGYNTYPLPLTADTKSS